MKRNRLIRSSNTASIFATAAPRISKLRSLFALSLLTFACIFIASVVLTSSESIANTTESQVIDLPNLPAELQTSTTTQQSLQTSIAIPELLGAESIIPSSEGGEVIVDHAHSAELAAIEQAIITTPDVSEPQSDIPAPEINWQQVTVKSGDNLSLIFPRVGLSARDVYNVAQLGDEIKPLLNLRPGQTLRFAITTQQDSKKLQQLQLLLSPIETLDIISADDGYQTTVITRDVEQRQMHASGKIESSLFEAGKQAGLSDKLVMELAYIFGWDIDFALDLRQDDHFKLLYSEDYLDGEKIADGAIVAAEFTNQGKTFRAVRYTDDTGLSRYYSPTGDSMRKAFSRTPVHFSRISSRFNPNRKHPVLKTSRPHRGVDYAAARGTPILATGDGKVDFAGTKGGYGRTVILTHGGKYTTLYAHMSRYKRGVKRGKRVHQGDVIGYIGSSGLATGPHLHYEFRVNGVHRNPLTVSLPKAEALAKKYRADFEQKSQPLLAQLDQVNNNILALND
ncbi:MAG: peptidoglycan DD-metalloendopeptidase family protein [Methylophagaceae bacterium]